MKSIEGMVDRATGNIAQESELVENLCWKHVYRRGVYRIILYRDPSDQEVKALTKPQKHSNGAAKTCFDKAYQDIKALNTDFAQTILNENKARNPQLWIDPDVGPVRWLRCEYQSLNDWYGSLDTLLHELNHELKTEKCLFQGITGKQICFELSDRLPSRDIARLDSLPTQNDEIRKAVIRIQSVYLEGDRPMSPFFLFDELNGYTTGLATSNAALRKLGRPAIFGNNGKDRARSLNFVPLFLLYTTRYLQLLKARDHELYAQEFEKNLGHKHAVTALLDSAEKTHRDWLNLIQQQEAPFNRIADIERALWEQYLANRKELRL